MLSTGNGVAVQRLTATTRPAHPKPPVQSALILDTRRIMQTTRGVHPACDYNAQVVSNLQEKHPAHLDQCAYRLEVGMTHALINLLERLLHVDARP